VGENVKSGLAVRGRNGEWWGVFHEGRGIGLKTRGHSGGKTRTKKRNGGGGAPRKPTPAGGCLQRHCEGGGGGRCGGVPKGGVRVPKEDGSNRKTQLSSSPSSAVPCQSNETRGVVQAKQVETNKQTKNITKKKPARGVKGCNRKKGCGGAGVSINGVMC